MAFTRGLSSAGNLDKVKTKVDLGCAKVQRVIEHFMETCYVLVAVLEMNCRSTGPRSYLNAQINPETWNEHHKTDLPHIKFCGRIAMIQDDLDRFWMREQPSGTWVDEIYPWTQVIRQPGFNKVTFDQCMTGLKDSKGTPMKKPTEIAANDDELLIPFAKYTCDGRHDHSQIACNRELAAAAKYTKKLCRVFVDAIKNLKESLKGRRYASEDMYPVTDPQEQLQALRNVRQSTSGRAPEGGRGCIGCARHFRANSPSHDRDPHTCRYWDTLSVYWKCGTCKKDQNQREPGHTFIQGECRFAKPFAWPTGYDASMPLGPVHDAAPEGGSAAASGSREGGHPRPPRPATTGDPTADRGSADMASAGRGDATEAGPSAASGSAPAWDPSRRPPAPPSPHPEPIIRRRRPELSTDDDAVRRAAPGRSSRGTGPMHLPDWSRFNIQNSLKALKSQDPAVIN